MLPIIPELANSILTELGIDISKCILQPPRIVLSDVDISQASSHFARIRLDK